MCEITGGAFIPCTCYYSLLHESLSTLLEYHICVFFIIANNILFNKNSPPIQAVRRVVSINSSTIPDDLNVRISLNFQSGKIISVVSGAKGQLLLKSCNNQWSELKDHLFSMGWYGSLTQIAE